MELTDIYFKKTKIVKGYIFNVSKFELPFNKVYLAESRFVLHILYKHREMNIEILKQIIENPDQILRENYRKNTFYFKKTLEGEEFFAYVVKSYPGLPKNKAYVVSSYKLKEPYPKNKHLKQKLIYTKEQSELVNLCKIPEMYNFDFTHS